MNVLIFDTETANPNSQKFMRNGNLIANLGGVVFDSSTFEVREMFDWGVSEVLSDHVAIANFYYKDNLPFINALERYSYAECISKLLAVMRRNSVSVMGAYNITFDKQALQDTCFRFDVPFLLDDYQLIDLYSMSCDMLRGSENYRTFCVENGRVSAAGNISANAESVYAYLNNKPTFEEAHTALADAKIESNIYANCLKYQRETARLLTTVPNNSCWRWIQASKRKER